nr:unnamed protein product [Spirometra erinaceieuropaei]
MTRRLMVASGLCATPTPSGARRRPTASETFLTYGSARQANKALVPAIVSPSSTLAPAGLCPRPEAGPAGRAGDKGDNECRCVDRPSPRHLQDEDPPTAANATSRTPPRRTDGTNYGTQFSRPPRLSLGRAHRQPQNWFDDNDAAISNPLDQKNSLHNAYVNRFTYDNKTAFYRSHRLVQQWLRQMQDAWTARKSEEIQGYADCNEWNNFFAAIKITYGPLTKATPPLPDTDVIKAVQQLSSRAAPGSNAIPVEIYKHCGPQLMDHLTELFQEMWRQGEVPQDCKDVTIVHLYMRTRNCQNCDNHRGVLLLNIAGKISARILLNRMNNHREQDLLPESLCGFRRHRGTTDIIFAARRLQEKCLGMLMLSDMLVDADRDEHLMIHTTYRTDGCLLHQRRMHFQSRASTNTVRELLFADDCALKTTTEGGMHMSMDLFSTACESFGLIIIKEKTMVMRQLPPDAAYFTPQINVNNA